MTGRRGARVLQFFWVIFVLGALLGSLVGMLAPFWPFWELANHFRPFVLLGTLVLAALLRVWGSALLFKISLALVMLNGTLLLPALANRASPGSPQAEPQQTLKIMTLNVWIKNRNIEAIVDLLRREQPDLVVFEEVTPWHTAHLLPMLADEYPFRYSCAKMRSCDLAIVAKRKWQRISHQNWSPAHAPHIDAIFDANGKGGRFHLLATHIAWPFHPGWQARDMKQLARWVQNMAGPLIVTGDFNLSPWAWKIWRFQQNTGLVRHTSFLASWPGNRRRPFVLLDHVFTSPVFRTVATKTGPFVGSDHLPVIVELERKKMDHGAE